MFGHVVRFPRTMDRAAQLLAVILAFLVIDWITVTLRCFVRVRIVRSFGLDDWLIVISLVSIAVRVRVCIGCAEQLTILQIIYTVLSGILIVGIHYGIGMHNSDLTAENATQALKVFRKIRLVVHY